MTYEWDPAKETANRIKHGIDFRQAAAALDGFILCRADDRRDYGEVRHLALACFDGVVLRVVFTPRGDRRRIISAWRASRAESLLYRDAAAGRDL